MKKDKKLLELYNRFNQINKSFLKDIHKIHRNYLKDFKKSINNFKYELMSEPEYYRDTVYHNHEPSDKLDYLDIRKTNIEKIKNIIFDLCIEEYDKQLALTNLGPHRQACKDRLKEINEERCWRLQDYEAFMWDFRKDWDLNYEDYVGISREEVCK